MWVISLKIYLHKLRQEGSILQGHPDMKKMSWYGDISTGSLGQGLSCAVGMAISSAKEIIKIIVYLLCLVMANMMKVKFGSCN